MPESLDEFATSTRDAGRDFDLDGTFSRFRDELRKGDVARRELAEIRSTLLANFGVGGRLAHLHEMGDGKERRTASLAFDLVADLVSKAEGRKA